MPFYFLGNIIKCSYKQCIEYWTKLFFIFILLFFCCFLWEDFLEESSKCSLVLEYWLIVRIRTHTQVHRSPAVRDLKSMIRFIFVFPMLSKVIKHKKQGIITFILNPSSDSFLYRPHLDYLLVKSLPIFKSSSQIQSSIKHLFFLPIQINVFFSFEINSILCFSTCLSFCMCMFYHKQYIQ